jgi:hypothetical protein
MKNLIGTLKVSFLEQNFAKNQPTKKSNDLPKGFFKNKNVNFAKMIF